MKRIVLIFGVISGLIAAAMMWLTLPLVHRGTIDFDNGLVVGYTSIVLSLLLVFFGIRAYRENHGGVISFGRGVAIGLLITLISGVFYVVSWEILYFNFMPDFGDKYANATIASLQKEGAPEAAVEAKKKEMEEMKVMMANPLLNAAMTFMEPFPVGLVMTLVSAGILRKRPGGLPGSAAAIA